MKVHKGVSTWRIWGFYIQCLKELTFDNSKSTGNNCPTQQLHPHPRHEPLPAT